MHPFCCVTTVSDTNHPSHKNFADHFPAMPPPHSSISMSSSARSDSTARSSTVHANQHHHNHSNNYNSHHNNGGGGVANGVELNQRLIQKAEPVDLKLNDLVGNGIAGLLYKWVNYGKGWRPRWFVLEDGVLSYYKIHGPDKIVVSEEAEKGSKIIGEDAMRRISKRYTKTDTTSQHHLNRKPFGEIHLKVSSIKESKSDDKRFSIFTGTKRLHLRAETREDRLAWMEALQAVKDMFPRMSNSELMAPSDNINLSTEKLRQRLVEEGVREIAIQETEQIMKSEFSTLQNQLMLLKQKQWMLMDTLRQLEVHVVKTRNRIRKSATAPKSPATQN